MSRVLSGRIQAKSFTGSGNASNGLSVDPGSGDFVLGDDGIAPHPAKLLSNRFIDLENFALFLQYIGSIVLGQNGGATIFINGDIAGGATPFINFMDLGTNGGTIDFDGPGGTFNFTYATGVPQVTGITIRNTNVAVYVVAPAADNGSLFQVDGNMTVGSVAACTALLHLAAGIANASGAPFKYTAGVNLAAPENGAKEFDGTNEFLTAGGVRYTLAKTLTATAALDFPNTNAQLSADLTIALTGAALGDIVLLGVPNASVVADSCYTAWVSAANTVTVRFNNYSAGAQNPASGTFRVSILKY